MTVHIRIKEEYALSVIEELSRNNAVDIVPEEEAFDVPEWQRALVEARKKEISIGKDNLIDEATFFAFLDSE